MSKKAVILLSGGLDSATTLFLAKKQGFECFCLVFDYGQRHIREIESARRIAKKAQCRCLVLKISFPWRGSALLDKKATLPYSKNIERQLQIPSTYVPARNTIFLSFALSYAEVIGAEAIFIGANAIDFSGYPDCRPQYYLRFNSLIRLATKTTFSGKEIKIITPLIKKSKAEIIRLANKLGVPLELTWSCYRGLKVPCGKCDSCLLRSRGFAQAKLIDPLLEKRYGAC